MNLLQLSPLSNENVAYNFKNEEDLNKVIDYMRKENIFLSAENFNDTAWKILKY